MSLQFWTQTMLFLLSVMNSGLKHVSGSTVTLATTCICHIACSVAGQLVIGTTPLTDKIVLKWV